MGFRADFIAVSPTVPRVDMLEHPEGGPRGAADFVERFMPGWRLTGKTVREHERTAYPCPRYIGTWGRSALVLGHDLDSLGFKLFLDRPEDLTVYQMYVSTVAGALMFDASGPQISRHVELRPAEPTEIPSSEDGQYWVTIETDGTPLPFERDYQYGDRANGTFPSQDVPIDEEQFGIDAWTWIVGLSSPHERLSPPFDELIENRAPERDQIVYHAAVEATADSPSAPQHRTQHGTQSFFEFLSNLVRSWRI